MRWQLNGRAVCLVCADAIVEKDAGAAVEPAAARLDFLPVSGVASILGNACKRSRIPRRATCRIQQP